MADPSLAPPPSRPQSNGGGLTPSVFAGRTPPHSVEAEEYLLSCCLLDGSDTIARCLESRLTPAAFYVRANQVIFEKLCELYQKSPPVSVEMLVEELRTTRQLEAVGGVPYLVQVSARIPTTAQAGYFIEKVRELHLLRELIKAATGAVEQCFSYQGGLGEFVDKVEQDIFRVTQDRVSDAAKPMKEPTHEAMTVIDKMMMKKGERTGVASGFKDLDDLTWGFQKQEMIVLAARPSVGKTSLALNIADAAVLPRRGGVPVPTLVFSLEMSGVQLALRMLCARALVDMVQLRGGYLPKNDEGRQQELLKAADELSKAPLFIDDSGHLTIMELRAKARRLYTRHKLGLIVVDYLQLISPTDPQVPREQQVAEASRGLKAMAKELDLPVFVLSQLNRSSEKENRNPRLSDLRESGSIEQDADVVLMLAPSKDADDQYEAAAYELVIAKQRNGPIGKVELTFRKNITRFEISAQ
jgi:replicative DNA helicase